MFIAAFILYEKIHRHKMFRKYIDFAAIFRNWEARVCALARQSKHGSGYSEGDFLDVHCFGYMRKTISPPRRTAPTPTLCTYV
jgi:hypothetical protein